MLAALAILGLLTVTAPWLASRLGRRYGYAAALVSGGLFLWFVTHVPRVTHDGERLEHLSWLPTLGSSLSFRLDGLGLAFALLITGIGALVALYTVGYLEDHPRLPRFWTALLLFQTAMLGLVLADDMVVLFVFWELTSVASFFLIGFADERPRARASAQQALLVTGAGGLALLVGLLLLGQHTGSFRLRDLLAAGPLGAEEPVVSVALVLILLGAATKSAQFPFHFWLPNAMEAPTPVSAYLHSATMVKAGVYLLARLAPAFAPHPWWQPALLTLGILTALVGTAFAVPQRDLKRLLAYSTVSALGVLVALLAFGQTGAKPFVLFLLAHASYKGGAFLVAGAIEHATERRTLDALGGLWRTAPSLALPVILVVLAAAGLPPTLGFVAKEATLEFGLATLPVWLLLLLSLAFVGQTAVAWLLLRPLLSAPPSPIHVHAAHWSLLTGPIALGLFATLSGVWLTGLAPLVSAVIASTSGVAPTPVALSLWHGLTPALAASGLIVVGAGLLALAWPRLVALGDRLAVTEPLPETPRGLGRFGPEHGYVRATEAVLRIAELQTRVLQNGYLRLYVSVIVATTLLLVIVAAVRRGVPWPLPAASWTVVDVVDAVLVFIIVASSFVAVRSAERLAAIAALGAVGFSLALLYARYGAPDLAITQVLVDTLTVVLLVFAFYRLPRYARLSSTVARARDALLASVFGLVMASFTILAHLFRYPERLSGFFAERAYPAAHGRNVVNVILVDFRALDTLGEITVLGLAALGVAALLASGKGARSR